MVDRMSDVYFGNVCLIASKTLPGEQLAAEASRAREEEKRLGTIIENAPHGALCKMGLQSLYNSEARCTCWKAGAIGTISRKER